MGVRTLLSALRTAPLSSSLLRSCQRARSLIRTEPETLSLVDSLPSMFLERISEQHAGVASGLQHISSRDRVALSQTSWTSRLESHHQLTTAIYTFITRRILQK